MPLVNKTFSDIITFTRASTATYFDSTGTLQSAAIDVPRLDYNPATLAARGLLIEEQRTNSIRNNTMVGAVAGTPGTLPTNWPSTAGAGTLVQEIVGTGTDAGITYIDYRLSGTTSTTAFSLFFEAQNQIVATSGQTWSTSFYVKLQAGSTTNITVIRCSTRGNQGVTIKESSNTNFTLTAVFQRVVNTFTLADALTDRVNGFLGITFASGVAIDITLRIGLPQLEQGAFATSVIPTTTTALTRSADVASVNTLSPWYNASEGTLFADWTSFIPNGTSPGSTYAAGFTDNIASSGAAQLTIQNRAVSNQIRVWQSTTGGGLDDSITPTSTTFQGKAAATYGGGSNVNASANGGAVVTMANPIQTTAFNALLLGLFTTAATGTGSNYLNGYLRRVTYYPRKLSSAELQAITA